MTTIEQLKIQLNICQDLGLTTNVERLQQQLDKLESPAPATFTVDISKLSESERDEFEERAAIMECDAGLSRAEAEKQALEIILERRQHYDK